jgi:SAM-dependent methyltransferase
MTSECLLALVLQLFNEPISGKRVLEVGSQDVNGSIRPFVEALGPKEYIGADMAAGKSVDVVCDSSGLIERFGKDSFDAVISSSMIEHTRDWKAAVHNMKSVCKPGGLILLTTCAPGFQYHGYPYDFWRYELQDLKDIFSDCQLLALETVFNKLVLIKLRKPQDFIERDLSDLRMFSLAAGSRIPAMEDKFERSWRYKKLILRTRILNALSGAVSFIGAHVI